VLDPVPVLVDEVELEDVGRRVVGVGRHPLLGVDLGTFQFGVKSATKDIKAIIICNLMFLNLDVKKVNLSTFQFGVKPATKDIKARRICNPMFFKLFTLQRKSSNVQRKNCLIIHLQFDLKPRK
jgi:hypothetical protein